MAGNRIKSLDGIRAISILMVLLGHMFETLPEAFQNEYVHVILFNSSLGVKIFFVISGYLITRLLIIEKNKSGKIDIKDFYLRRIFRIFPVFYLYIIIVLLLKATIFPDILNNYTLVGFAGLYLWNYKHLFVSDMPTEKGNWFFGHFWSLSMEEQFYMIWPMMFVKINAEKLKKVVLWIICIMPVLRIATYFLMPDSRGQISMMLHTGGDSILTGCLVALLEVNLKFQEKVNYYLNKKFLPLAIALFIFIVSPLLSMYLKGAYTITVGMSLNNICIIYLILWAIRIPSKVADFLNTKVLIHIGILSYSLYIWQQLFLTNQASFSVNKFPLNIIAVVIVAHISYYLIEKPMLNLKKKFKHIKTGQ
ncbi:MAG: acyltransferase family protein [Bacteroidia bacterium]